MLLDFDIAEIPLTDLSTSHVIGDCRQRNGAGAGPSTINHDVSYLSSVLAFAKLIYSIDYTNNSETDARPPLLQMELLGKSKRRCRRPASDKLNGLLWQGLSPEAIMSRQESPSLIFWTFRSSAVCGWGKCVKFDGKTWMKNKGPYWSETGNIRAKNQVTIC